MAGITLAQAESHLSSWLAADTAVASGQSYTIGGRTLTRAHAAEIRKNLDYWQGWVDRLATGSGGARVRYHVPGE